MIEYFVLFARQRVRHCSIVFPSQRVASQLHKLSELHVDYQVVIGAIFGRVTSDVRGV